MKRILFVCLGNICRSPAAEGLFQSKAAEMNFPVFCDSAGTGAWHVGRPPDKRMQVAAKRRGIDLSHQQARQVGLADFYEFDYLMAMDLSNLADLLSMAPPNRKCDIRLFLDFATSPIREVPDPYYGGADGFERVLDLLDLAATGLLQHLENDDRD